MLSKLSNISSGGKRIPPGHPGARLKSALRAGYFLALHKGLGKVQHRKVGVKNVDGKWGTKCRLYAAKGSSYRVIVLHGLTANGYRYPKLVRFASNLALCGFKVYTPNLEGMSNLDLRFEDIEKLVEITTSMGKSKLPIGIIGFSTGGSYALILAAHKKVRKRVGFVLAGGAYYSLEDLFDYILSDRNLNTYSRLIVSWGARENLDLSEKDEQMFEDIMMKYTEKWGDFTLKEKELIKRIEKRSTERKVAKWLKKRSAQYYKLDLSQSPYLSSICAPVFLMHAAGDRLIPVEETQKIQKELLTREHYVGISIRDTIRHTSFVGTSPMGALKILYNIMNISTGR